MREPPPGAVQVGWFNLLTLRLKPLDTAQQRQGGRMTETVIALERRSPADIDTELGVLDEKAFHTNRRILLTLHTLHHYAGDKDEYVSRNQKRWRMPDDEAVAKCRARVATDDDQDIRIGLGAVGRALGRYDEATTEFAELLRQANDLEGEFDRRGGWSRAFIVRGHDGHIHSSRRCRTCRWNTQFGWLPDYSGRTEAQIVEAAGRMACTVCYPSAPLDTLSLPSKIEKMRRYDA